MEVSGTTIAPGIASPTYPSTGGGWNNGSRGASGTTRTSSDAPASPVSPNIPEEDHGDYYNPYEGYDGNSPHSPVRNERTRNSIAARDIAREIDLQLSSPSGGLSPSPTQQSFQPPPNTSPVRPLSIGRAPSPLVPPQAPYSQARSVSPSPNTYNAPPDSPRGTGPGGAASPMPSEAFATPPEYPGSPPTSTPTSAGIAGVGARTISAAAFKRGGGRALPASPYPAARLGGHGPTSSQDSVGRLPVGAQPPDYFAGQTQREPGSPDIADYGAIGNTRIANVDQPPSSPGYGQNQYVTRLD